MAKSVIVNNVTKKYKLYNKNSEKLLDILLPKSYGEDFYALRNVSFEAEEGDVIGFVGINGSGKSTLSNIIAGIIPETSGSVEVKGQTALIAVASGLNNELSGRENIELKLLMLGFNKNEIKKLEPEIIEFSELGKFIDQPVKSYSSGMKSRLGFSISVNIDPDVLIIDEALSVGDKAFAEKSLAKMKEFKARGKTMFFVSHSIGQMKQFCEKAVWLEFGELKMYGDVKEVIPAYEKFLKDYKAMTKEEQKKFRQNALSKQSVPATVSAN
ncbi:teichoic acids export ABC transporter ATP-binding subunit TagH [Cytobacillus firmus]|uniref:Teichoic acids export ABC transporter ATP-binding subunit TagH n=2 Tax=Cytobacillus firmus TaxID=1399 RepID=A0AA46P8T5_CYTFI|nr:teichoic acids export ABC transporter ATP-binding subunit TagH [Cytobacillus firmus]KML41326.1 teichoic acids export protein ATP-binding subunit [Cytobacillus firmus]UYG97939.1 teichoic acids export ABC transporter ATP-binding subunit TagH [Cytobacillus firmus]